MRKLFVAALLVSIMITGYLPENGPGKPARRLVPLGVVEITSYQAVPEQTDAAPFMTASGIDLRETSEKVCALSQDLLWFKGGLVRWGDLVILRISGRPDLSGPWRVVDTMAEEVYRNGEFVPIEQHIDLLIDEYGKWSGDAWLVKE